MGTLETIKEYRDRIGNPPAKIQEATGEIPMSILANIEHEPRKARPTNLALQFCGMVLFVGLVFSFLHFVLRG